MTVELRGDEGPAVTTATAAPDDRPALSGPPPEHAPEAGPPAASDHDAASGLARGPSLSPSRAADFKTCPLLYRFRTIDRIPEQPTQDQARGTLVHAVLERLFDLPAPERTRDAAVAALEPQWRRLTEESEELAALFDEPEAAAR
ncbi:MAG: RecB family exonuclease, partial [Micromonosporaceae bacterium]